MIENRIHRDHTLNPRKWPEGDNRVKDAPRDIIRATKGKALLHEYERELLYYLPGISGEGDYANLGHARGGSAILMAKYLNDNNLKGIVESVDLFNTVNHFKVARALLMEFNLINKVNLRKGSTDFWGKEFKSSDRKFKGIFIDADHSYESVKGDIIMWSPMVIGGGWIAFHDTNQDFSHKAIEETIIKFEEFKERTDLHVKSIRVFVK